MFHALHCLQTIRTIVRESPMMQEGSAGVMYDKGMAHDHDSGHDSGHNMMDPEHVAHCIGYIAQVSFERESLSPFFGAGFFDNLRDVQCHLIDFKFGEMTADASWLLPSSICSVPPTARSSLHGSDKIRRESPSQVLMAMDMSINAGITVYCGMWLRIQSNRPFRAGIGSRVIQLKASFERERNSMFLQT